VVEIDRGTMPVVRSDTFRQTSFEEKMRAYLTAHAGKQRERQFGWKTFRVLTVTTDHRRVQSMMEALRKLRVPHNPGAPSSFSQRAPTSTRAIRSRTSGATATAARFS
jgi:hypothetical protein